MTLRSRSWVIDFDKFSGKAQVRQATLSCDSSYLKLSMSPMSVILGEYRCSCLHGYTGSRCETETNECQSAPCNNGGHCVDIINNFTCICPPGKIIINPYLTNGFSNHYQLDESTFSFRDVRSDFKILFHFSMKFL